MSCVLVTGASGFLGAEVLARLVSAGHAVHALTHRARASERADVSWHQLDLLDGEATAAALAEIAPEGLVHLAWFVEHGRFWRAPENVLWVEATLRLLRAFVAAGGRRAVLAGTCAEYDWSAPAPFAEDSPLVPATLYGTAKHATQLVASAFASEVGLELAWARVFIPYGPGEAGGRLGASVARALLAGEPVDVTEGTQLCDFMFVEDVGAAFAAIFDARVCGAINVASGDAHSVRELVEQIAAASGRPELVRWGALTQRAGEPARLLADITRLREEVGFSASVGLEAGVARTVEWVRGGG